MGQSLLDFLDDYCVERIAAFLVEPLNAPLRAICPRMRGLIRRPARMTNNELLIHGAKLGNVAVCELARSHGAMELCIMLRCGAKVGSRAICELARKWTLDVEPYVEYRFMFHGAAKHNHRDLCELAWRWLREEHQPRRWCKSALNIMFMHGATREIRELALDWIEQINMSMAFKPIRADVGRMLACAAHAGDLDGCMHACSLARDPIKQFSLSVHEVRAAFMYARDPEVIMLLNDLIMKH